MMTAKTTPAHQDEVRHLSSIKPEELAVLGMNAIAYARLSIKEHGGDSVEGFTIHAANGERIGWAPNLDLANAAILQHDMKFLAGRAPGMFF